MAQAQPKPKRRTSEELPGDLVDFLSDVAALVAEGAEATRIPSDDLLQCKCAYGGLCDEGGDTFAFVYFPSTPVLANRSRVRWELELTHAQLELVADGSLRSLPFWACSDAECRKRFWTSDELCFDCDNPDRAKTPLPEGRFASRREWALAFFDLDPSASPFAMIGAYNGTDCGETLGYFSLGEAQAAQQEYLSRSRKQP